MKSYLSLFMKSLLVFTMVLIFSSGAYAQTQAEFTASARQAFSSNMSQSNLTEFDKLFFVMNEVALLRHYTFNPSYRPFNGPTLEQDVLDIKSQIGNVHLSINDLDRIIATQQSVIDRLNAEIQTQNQAIRSLKSQIDAIPNSGSFISTVGTAFKTLGETLLSMSTESSTVQPAPVPVVTPAPTPSTPTPVLPETLLAPTRIISSAPAEGGFPFSNALDGNPATYFAKDYRAKFPVNLMVDFPTPTVITRIEIVSRILSDDLVPESIEIFTSDTGQLPYTWRVMRGISEINSGRGTSIVGYSQPSKYWQLTFPEKITSDRNQLQIAEIRLYGYSL